MLDGPLDDASDCCHTANNVTGIYTIFFFLIQCDVESNGCNRNMMNRNLTFSLSPSIFIYSGRSLFVLPRKQGLFLFAVTFVPVYKESEALVSKLVSL